MRYVKFKLTPGQQAPADGNSTGSIIPGTDWLVWQAPDGTDFPEPGLTHADMTQQEIDDSQPAAIHKRAVLQLVDNQNVVRTVLMAMAVVIQAKIRKLKNNQPLPDQTLEELLVELRELITTGAVT